MGKGLMVADYLLVKVTTDQGLERLGARPSVRAVSSAKLAIDISILKQAKAEYAKLK